jgi:hypothetical protein
MKGVETRYQLLTTLLATLGVLCALAFLLVVVLGLLFVNIGGM